MRNQLIELRERRGEARYAITTAPKRVLLLDVAGASSRPTSTHLAWFILSRAQGRC